MKRTIRLALILIPLLILDVYAELVVPTERVSTGVTVREGQSSASNQLGSWLVLIRFIYGAPSSALQ